MTGRATGSTARRALLALALGGFGIGTGEFVMLGLLPDVAGDLHTSIPQGGYLISAYALGVVAGGLVQPHRRSQAMAVVFAGLTSANVIGVPLGTWAGQHASWRAVYVGVAAVELVAGALIVATVAHQPVEHAGREALRRELRVF